MSGVPGEANPSYRLRPKVLITLAGLDGHWVGAMSVATALRDHGYEVVYAGALSPTDLVSIALQEDVDVIGVSVHSAATSFILETLDLLKARASSAGVIVGGILPVEDIPLLKKQGVIEVFPPGSTMDVIIRTFNNATQGVTT